MRFSPQGYQVGEQRDEAEEILGATSVDETYRHQTAEEAYEDIEGRKADGLDGTAEKAADVGLSQKAAVDHDLKHKEDSQNADLHD